MDYFARLEAIQQNKKPQILWYQFCRLFLLYRTLFWIFFFLFQDALSPFTNVVHFNIIYIHGFAKMYNIWVAGFVWLAYYYGDLMYRKNNSFLYLISKKCLIKKNFDFFLNPYWKNGKLILDLVNLGCVVLRNFFQFLYFSNCKLYFLFCFVLEIIKCVATALHDKREVAEGKNKNAA